MNTKLKPEFMAIVDESTPVTLATAQRWFRQRSTDDLGDMVWIATEHNHLIRADAMRLLGPALVEDLYQAVVSGHRDFTQYDALLNLGSLFCTLWARGDSMGTVRLIKARLGNLVAGWPERGLDLVILAVLEHLFADSEKLRFFESWLNEPELKSAYVEAVRLSQ